MKSALPILSFIFGLVMAPLLSSADPTTIEKNVFTSLTRDQKISFTAVLESQCEYFREMLSSNYDGGLNHVIYTLDLSKRVFSKVPTLYGDCRAVSIGGVPVSFLDGDRIESRISGWIGIELNWLIDGEILRKFSGIVFKETYEKRWKTPWNLYSDLFYKKMASPTSCIQIAREYVAKNRDKEIPIDIRAHSKIYLTTNREGLLIEDSNEYKEDYYPWTLLKENDHLLVGVGFEPRAYLDWQKSEVHYRDNPGILKHINGSRILLDFERGELEFSESADRFDLANYIVSNLSKPADKTLLSCTD